MGDPPGGRSNTSPSCCVLVVLEVLVQLREEVRILLVATGTCRLVVVLVVLEVLVQQLAATPHGHRSRNASSSGRGLSRGAPSGSAPGGQAATAPGVTAIAPTTASFFFPVAYFTPLPSRGSSFSLSLVFKVPLFSLSFVIVRERAPGSYSAGSVCRLRLRRPWCAVKKLLRPGALRVGNGPSIYIYEEQKKRRGRDSKGMRKREKGRDSPDSC